MTVTRAKFRCTARTEFEHNNRRFTFVPVMAKEGEDSIFGKYTPSGSLEFLVSGESMAEFEAGKSYYADFTPAE